MNRITAQNIERNTTYNSVCYHINSSSSELIKYLGINVLNRNCCLTYLLVYMMNIFKWRLMENINNAPLIILDSIQY